MRANFLSQYRESFAAIEGAFQFDAALLFMAYNQLIQAQGIQGDTLEIGVRHGLSSIAIASLRGANRKFFAVDLFDESDSQSLFGQLVHKLYQTIPLAPRVFKQATDLPGGS